MKYIDFNDPKLPIGKRKQAYVKWAISKGTDPIKAKKQANDKFGFEQKEGLLLIVSDYGRMHQRSFCVSQIFDGHDTRKYKNTHWILDENHYELDDSIKKTILEYKAKGWDVFIKKLYG